MFNNIKKLALAATIVASFASSAFAASSSSTNDVVIDTNKHIVKNTFENCVRTQWATGSDKCAPVAPQVAAPAKEPTGHSRSYLVFFDFDKSNLRPDAVEILNKAASDAKANKATSFKVTGHTDRAGSVAYNVALSKARAAAVKNKLAALSGNTEVKTEAKGESEPLVATADGVREPQNRRAEIVYYYVE